MLGAFLALLENSAAMVPLPTLPSALSLLRFWKADTADSVEVPK